MPDGIYVWIVATHSDKPINNRIYKSEEMRKQVETWLKPYKKPVLRHHDDKSDPVGRVVDQMYVTRNYWPVIVEQLGLEDVPFPEDQTGQLLVKQHITDPDAVQKIKDGRYHTVSVGFSAEHLYCSVCGFDWQTGEQCKHQIGQEYDGQVMYLVPEGITYKEISFVNTPADEHAQIVKRFEESSPVVIPNASFRILLTDQASDTIDRADIPSDTTDQNPENDVSHPSKVGREVENMDESVVRTEYEALKKQFEDLQMRYNSLVSSLKEEIVDEIIQMKQWLGHSYSDEELNRLREKYGNMSVEMLKAIKDELEDEIAFLEKFFTDEQEKVEAEVPNEPTAEAKAEEKKDEKVETAPQPAQNPVGFVNNAVEKVEFDAVQYVKRILGIGGDSK